MSAELFDRVASQQARPLPAEGLAAIVGELWPGGSLVSLDRIHGGLGAAMHRLVARDTDGRVDAVVLRSYLAAYGNGPEVAEREHATLTALARADAPTPWPRWLDAAGGLLGRPALAMDVVPGRPLVADRSPDVVALGRALAAVHAVPTAGFGHLPGPGSLAAEVRRAIPAGALPGGLPPADGFVDGRDLWARIDRWTAVAAPAPPALVHGDFHPGNVLGDGDRTSVVDWTWASVGDPARDLAYCRYDIALAAGRAASDAFVAAYLDAHGPARPSPGWELVAVASSLPSPAGWLRAFLEHGRDDCTAEGFEAAGRAFLAEALARAAAGAG